MQFSWMLLMITAVAANSTIENKKTDKKVNDVNHIKGAKTFHMETLFKGTFYQASSYCSRLGMELVSFNSQEEFDELKDFIVKTFPNVRWTQFWTSGVAMEPLKFKWIHSGLPVNLSGKWEFLQPNNLFGVEDCLEVKFNEDAGTMLMNDVRCLAQNYIVCQKV